MAELMTAVKAGNLIFLVKMFSVLNEDEVAHVVSYQTPEAGETLLFSACVKGHLEMIRFLLAEGRGQRDLYTVWGAGPLHAAAERCHEAVVRLLLKYGANLNAQTSYGDTPVHLAAYRGHYEIVKHLVEAGCNLGIRNSKGKTALDDATGARHGRIVQYLTAVMYPDGCATEERKVDLMKTQPLVWPIKTHQKLDRSISWHSCPDNILNRNGSSWPDGDGEGGREFSASSVVVVEPPMNDLSMRGASSPRWDDSRGMNVIPEVSSTTGDQKHHGEKPTFPSTRSYTEERREYRNRSASDSRVEYLEKMVKRLRLGLTVTQEELGKTRSELRRARELLRSPTRQAMEDGSI